MDIFFYIFSTLILLYFYFYLNKKPKGILSDKEIIKLIKEQSMITKISKSTVGISSGVSSFGFDSQLHSKIYLFEKNYSDKILDPKNFDKTAYKEIVEEEFFILPAYSFALGRTREYFNIPEDILVICLAKSTYARCGLIINVTPLEPGWEGYVTLELSNSTPHAIKVYVNEGICQFVFLRGENRCCVSYKDKKGKYMNQNDITLPLLKKQ